MNTDRNSDESVVPATSANNEATEASAESSEGRDENPDTLLIGAYWSNIGGLGNSLPRSVVSVKCPVLHFFAASLK